MGCIAGNGEFLSSFTVLFATELGEGLLCVLYSKLFCSLL